MAQVCWCSSHSSILLFHGIGMPHHSFGDPTWYSTLSVGLATAVFLLPDRIFRLPTWADGIIVMDSGAYIKGPYYWQEYVATLLSRVHENTGQYCIAVCLGGLRFAGPNNGKTYERLLDGIMAQYPRPPRFMVWVSFGNDIYPPQEDMRRYEACD